MLLKNEEIERIKDQFDIYDLLEELNISIEEFIDAFDYLIVDNEHIMFKITEGLDDDSSE